MIVNRKTVLLNLVFILVCAGILFVLLKAPEESTSRLPLDEVHRPFQSAMEKKEAEKHCGRCHGPEGESPLPEGHPPPYRCLFCHKRQP
jgi:cytochrome c553